MSAARKIVPAVRGPELFDDLPMSQSHYEFFSKLMYKLSGVNLPFSSKNESLVKNRIFKLLRQTGHKDYDQLIEQLKNPSPALLNDFICCLTTNKTHFFREDAHFNWFKQFLSTHFKTNSELRVWCAAASTGQEPYTISILLNEHLTDAETKKTKFLATDIDLKVLDKGSKGIYRENEMDGCPMDLRKKYFSKVTAPEVAYKANDKLVKTIRFAQFNLIQDNYPFQHKFHVIFCRNVLIYFDPPTTKKVVENLVSQLAPGGYLILGHSEAGSGKVAQVKQVAQAIFQKHEGK
jgi:chemotaxis protein methyltransferase CheR